MSGSTGSLEQYFGRFRKNIIGIDHEHDFLCGRKPIVYADWAATGRLYRPIEEAIVDKLGPYVANTHTETTSTGRIMTEAYHQARRIIKEHVNASDDDVLLFAGFGMTAVVNKFQRILGLRVPVQYRDTITFEENNRPLVVITHMEHHSNQTTWEECVCDVEIIRRGPEGLPDLAHLRGILEKNRKRTLIIGAFTACSNVTGILTPYHEMARIVHEFGGYCFIDFAASAAYVDIDMHPRDEMEALDAIYFSPHKFLGGPGSSGVIVFNRKLYHIPVPDQPGGGTVAWTNPWGGHHFFEDIEVREDGGTPGVLQAIRASMAVLLKEEMGVGNILAREGELKNKLLDRLLSVPSVKVLEGEQRRRIAYTSFYSDRVHHNLIVRLLNDRFGIQSRGGCSCAGTYGHILLHIGSDRSKRITDMIDRGDLSLKPGWARLSLHPTMRDEEIDYIADSLEEIMRHHETWAEAYRFNSKTGDFDALDGRGPEVDLRQVLESRVDASRTMHGE